MPGAVTEASVTPNKGSSVDTQGRTATFKLDASQPTVTINVTAQRVRWGYLALAAYVLAFIAFKVFETVGRALRLKPRKI